MTPHSESMQGHSSKIECEISREHQDISPKISPSYFKTGITKTLDFLPLRKERPVFSGLGSRRPTTSAAGRSLAAGSSACSWLPCLRLHSQGTQQSVCNQRPGLPSFQYLLSLPCRKVCACAKPPILSSCTIRDSVLPIALQALFISQIYSYLFISLPISILIYSTCLN